MIDLGEEEPAFEQLADVLHHKRRQQGRGVLVIYYLIKNGWQGKGANPGTRDSIYSS